MKESKTYIIGFEGGDPPDEKTLVNYGAGALCRGDRLINPVTGFESSMKEWPELVEAGYVGELPFPVELPEEMHGKPIYVLISRADFCAIILHHTQVVLGTCPHFSAGPTYVGIIYPSFEDLKRAAATAAAHIRALIESYTPKDPNKPIDVERWRDVAQILDPWDGLGQEKWVRRFLKQRG